MVNSAGLMVDLAKMEEFIAEINSILEMLKKHLTQLDDAIDLLVQSWKGEAAEAYKENHDFLRKSYEKLFDALESKQKNLELAHTHYIKAIDRNAILVAHV